ncbi:hypothetical protein EsH8_X_000313 [Colletotrichum jinshuiense]
MDSPSQSLSRATSSSPAVTNIGGFPSSSLADGTLYMAESNPASTAQLPFPTHGFATNSQQTSSTQLSPTNVSGSGLVSALEDLQVASQQRPAQTAAEIVANESPASAQYDLNLESDLSASGFVTLNAHESDEARRHYNPDEDEVESVDGDAISEDEFRPDDNFYTGVDEQSNQIEELVEEEVEDEEDEDDDEEDDEGVDEEVTENAQSEIGNNTGSEDDPNESDENEADPSQPSEPTIDLYSIGCSAECQQEFQQGVDYYKTQIELLEDRIRSLTIASNTLRVDLDRANAQVTRLQRNRIAEKRTKATWPEKLRRFLTDPEDVESESYDDIYKTCCKEENMSTVKDNIHPNLRFRPPTAHEHQADISDALFTEVTEVDVANQFENEHRDFSDELFVQDDEHPEDNQSLETLRRPRAQGSGGVQSVPSIFPIDQLPVNVLANVFKFIFYHENKLVHCITRLDPFLPPEELPRTNVYSSGLLHRFHLSGKSCNITHAIKPHKHLALLSVCKRWHYLGIHAFYGLNTFAFSSFGEFGRFCTGIGPARRERIQHIELLWVGNQYLSHKPILENNKFKWVSKRTWDVSWLCQMPRLRSLIVHVNESGYSYMRRKHEPSSYKDWMASVTGGQPNFRLTRSLRNLQGLDYIHQLRGMELIQFYDFELSLKYGGRHRVRDWSFCRDIENVTAMPKVGDRVEEAKLENLTPVLKNLVASDEDLNAIKAFYQDSAAFDAEYMSPQPPVIAETLDEGEGRSGDIEMPDAEYVSPPPFAAEGPGEGDDVGGDIEMLDAENADLRRRDATARKANQQGGSPGSEKIPFGATAKQSRHNSPADPSKDSEADMAAEDDDEATPKAIALNVRTCSVESSTSTATEVGPGDDFDSKLFMAGSNANNPIDLDSIELSIGSQVLKLQQEVCTKREPSETSSTGHLPSRESDRSVDNDSGLFVHSPTLRHDQYPRERSSTSMIETLRKRGFAASAVRNIIDLTCNDDAHLSTDFPSSSQPSSSRPGGSWPYNNGGKSNLSASSVSFNFPYLQRQASDEEENPFKKPRRR